jgi:hypothetical protein
MQNRQRLNIIIKESNMKIISRTLVIALVLSVFAFAHNGTKHVKGIVQKVNADSIVVKTEDKGNVTVPFNSATQWENEKVAGGPKDVRPGARVVVDVPETGENMAVKVRYDTTKEQKHHKKH